VGRECLLPVFQRGQVFTAKAPCEASELVHFRNRIGSEGVELILKRSIRINGKGGKEDKASIDTAVQEKNITYPGPTANYTGRSSTRASG